MSLSMVAPVQGRGRRAECDDAAARCPSRPVTPRSGPWSRTPGCAPGTPRARPARGAANLPETQNATEVLMSTTQVGSDTAQDAAGGTAVPLRLEVTVLPVSDVDRAKAFYERLGWRLDADLSPADDYRVVQFTPPGSSASIQFGKGMTTQAPGSAQGLMMAVQNVEAAREELTRHGAEVGEIWHGRGISPGTEGHIAGPDPERGTYRTYTSFTDPDGNRFILQEITERLPGRISEMDVAALAELLQETAARHG